MTGLRIAFCTDNTSNATWRKQARQDQAYPLNCYVVYWRDGVPETTWTVWSYGDVYHRVTLPLTDNPSPGTTYKFIVGIPSSPYEDHLQYTDPQPRSTPPDWVGDYTSPEELSFTTPTTWTPGNDQYYVAPVAAGAKDGSSCANAMTLTEASEVARAGDEIICCDGVYKEAFAPAATGVVDHPITIRPQNCGAVCLDGDYVRPSGIVIHGQQHIVVDGLAFRRFGNKIHSCRAGCIDGQVFLPGSQNVTVKNCVMAGWGITYDTGIAARRGDDLLVENCVLTGFETMAGVYGPSSMTATFNRNTWYVPQITNINFDIASVSTNASVTLTNNLFFGQAPDKAQSGQAMVCAQRPTFSNYNGFYYNEFANRPTTENPPPAPNNHVLKINYGVAGRGLAVIQAAPYNSDPNSLEASADQVSLPETDTNWPPTSYMTSDFTQTTPPQGYNCSSYRAFSCFVAAVASGELIPKIEMFDPESDYLDDQGEGGVPIGARPCCSDYVECDCCPQE